MSYFFKFCKNISFLTKRAFSTMPAVETKQKKAYFILFFAIIVLSFIFILISIFVIKLYYTQHNGILILLLDNILRDQLGLYITKDGISLRNFLVYEPAIAFITFFPIFILSSIVSKFNQECNPWSYENYLLNLLFWRSTFFIFFICFALNLPIFVLGIVTYTILILANACCCYYLLFVFRLCVVQVFKKEKISLICQLFFFFLFLMFFYQCWLLLVIQAFILLTF